MTESKKVTIHCSGGCGRSVTLRASKVEPAQYYLCQSREDGGRCAASLPPVPPGMARKTVINAAGTFWGFTDEPMSPEVAASVARARQILATGIAQRAIEKARGEE